jgi:hypothetical protein
MVDMRGISRARFDALAAYCRDPRLQLLGEEIAWFEAASGNIVATIIFDGDDEFSGQVLARDLNERFRWVAGTGNADGTGYFDTPELAVIAMRDEVIAVAAALEQHRRQGDETGRPVDFFTPAVAQGKLHPHFLELASGDAFSAARETIGAMMRWYDDADGNFVEQFQTTGFDARLWELYLFAMLTEANFVVARPRPAPDFLVRGITGEFALEATTINPSVGSDRQRITPPKPETAEEKRAYFKQYLPIRYAGPLTAKLRKAYWEQPAASGKPLVFAIQDFHDRMSMAYSGTALAIYLYGFDHEAHRDGKGRLRVTPRQVEEHRWGGKVVPTGFFKLPDAEHVSAVLFNSGGTLSKFNRMGVCAGFGVDNVVLIRQGTAITPDPDASEGAPYLHFVTEGYPETWIEGMDVYHNPTALHPLDPALLPGAAHHRLMAGGQIQTTLTGWKPVDSSTSVLVFPANLAPSAASRT